MDLNNFKKSWSGLQNESKFYKRLCVGLVGANLVLGCFLFTKETIVIVQPWTLTQTAQLEQNKAARNYKESWALAVAELLGNITPGNVDFVVERIKPLLAPSIYNEVVRNANEQALYLKEDRISQSFMPRTVEYEASTNKVFVKGNSYTTGASGLVGKDEKGTRNEMTFEFVIEIKNYLPLIKSMEVYSGQARTGKVLKRMEQVQKRQEAREAKLREKENN